MPKVKVFTDSWLVRYVDNPLDGDAHEIELSAEDLVFIREAQTRFDAAQALLNSALLRQIPQAVSAGRST